MTGRRLKRDGARPPSPDASDLEGFVGYNLKRAYVVVQKDFRAALGEDGLSARTFSALSVIVRSARVTQSRLARALGIERSGVVAMIDELERRGYVARAEVPGDRRVQALVPSARGRAAYARALGKVKAHEASLLAHLDGPEKRRLLGLLKKIRQGPGAK